MADVKRVDLSGVTCPMNFVKTKVALSTINVGEVIEVVLDEGDPILNVPRSLKEEGHKVLKVVPEGETFIVSIQKGAD